MRCPVCHSALVDAQGRARECAHCGHAWRGSPASGRRLPPVPYLVVECPHCAATDTEVYRTARPRRYHKCRACGETFVSVEVRAEGVLHG